MDLLLTLRSDLGRQAAVEHALRDAIVVGALQPGAPLPSTRALAAELGLARGTVVAAVEQLSAEGILETRPGARTRVAHVPPSSLDDSPAPRSASPDAPEADFRAGDPDLTLFPRAAWTTAVRNALDAAEAGALGYGDPRGDISLRVGLLEYLGRTRGVVASPDRTFVTAGFSQTLALVGRVLAGTGPARAVVEDPSFWRHRELLVDAGLDCVGVEVDADGLRTDDLPADGVAAALVTPGHHTPLGVSLSPPRRARLVSWAAETGAHIVEDDYDGELRYDRRPLRALHSLDPARVIYCGTASKSFAPGLRLSWCVLPAALVDAGAAVLASIGGPSVSVVEQLALADLLRSGRYDRQVRRIRSEYRRRRDQLVTAVGREVPSIRVEGVDAGLKALLRLPAGVDETEVVHGLAERSVAVAPLTAFQLDGRVSPRGPAIVVNYGRPYAPDYRRALQQLVAGLRTLVEPASGESGMRHLRR
ncbi:MAG TPA: PLP-dependent aminotransferase family protein [Iamia sp.]